MMTKSEAPISAAIAIHSHNDHRMSGIFEAFNLHVHVIVFHLLFVKLPVGTNPERPIICCPGGKTLQQGGAFRQRRETLFLGLHSMRDYGLSGVPQVLPIMDPLPDDHFPRRSLNEVCGSFIHPKRKKC